VDDGGGLYLMGARHYDARTGRFLQRDPIGFEGGWNLYAYAGGNSVDKIDPQGKNYVVLTVLSVNAWAEATSRPHTANLLILMERVVNRSTARTLQEISKERARQGKPPLSVEDYSNMAHVILEHPEWDFDCGAEGPPSPAPDYGEREPPAPSSGGQDDSRPPAPPAPEPSVDGQGSTEKSQWEGF
jgi:uncharacterized protein RhaS with RHS repeats